MKLTLLILVAALLVIPCSSLAAAPADHQGDTGARWWQPLVVWFQTLDGWNAPFSQNGSDDGDQRATDPRAQNDPNGAPVQGRRD